MIFKHQKGGIILLIIFLSIGKIIAQEGNEKALSLEEAIEQTLAQNQQIKIARLNQAAAQTDVDKMKSIYLPQVEASATGSVNNIPLHAFGTKLQQGAISQADFAPSSLNSPASITNLQTQIMVKQPIFNQDIKPMQAALNAKLGAYQLQSIRTEKVLSREVRQAYLQLQLIYEMGKVLNKAKITTEANLKLAKDNLEAGYIQQADVLAVEVRLTEIETQLLQVTHNIQNISDQLSFLMGQDYGQKYMPTSQLNYEDKSAILLPIAPLNRSDIKAMEKQIEAHSYMITAHEKTNLPRINAFGSYGLNNRLDFSEAQHGYMIGIQASWLIFDGHKNKNNIRKAKMELEKSQTQLKQLVAKNQLELTVAKRKMIEAQSKIELSQKSIAQAKEALRVKTDRFAEGLERTTDVLIAETTVAQKEMEYIEAIFQYQSAHSDLLLILEGQ
jgi:outer membrane protein TolC